MKKHPRAVIVEWAPAWAVCVEDRWMEKRKRHVQGAVGLYIARFYRIVRGNDGASSKLISPTVGVRFSGTVESP